MAGREGSVLLKYKLPGKKQFLKENSFFLDKGKSLQILLFTFVVPLDLSKLFRHAAEFQVTE